MCRISGFEECGYLEDAATLRGFDRVGRKFEFVNFWRKQERGLLGDGNQLGIAVCICCQ
jgi:hypothetical protein